MALMLSVTDLSSYLYCPRKLFLSKILEIEVPVKDVMVLGSIRHNAYDLINKKEEEIVKSIKEKASLENVFRIYKNQHLNFLRKAVIKNKRELKSLNLPLLKTFKQVWPYIEIETRERAINVFSFIAKNNVYGEDLWNLLTPKIESELKIVDEELRLKGIIDMIEVYDNGVIPLELKTGSAPNIGVWPGHKIQIGCYMLLLENTGKKVKAGFIKYLDLNEKREVLMNPFLKNDILSSRDSIFEMFSSLEIPPILENSRKCLNCDFKDTCHNTKFIENELKNRECSALRST